MGKLATHFYILVMNPLFIKAYLKRRHGSLCAFAKSIGVSSAHLGNVISGRDRSKHVEKRVYDAIIKDAQRDAGETITIKQIFPNHKA